MRSVLVGLRVGAAVLAAGGCADVDPAGDRAAFLGLRCEEVRDAVLRDECWLFTVQDAPDRLGDVCPRITRDTLRDECRFMAIDARKLVGHDAARACGAAGRFVAACHANAISREVSRLPDGTAESLAPAIERIVRQYRAPRPGEVAELARRRGGARAAETSTPP